MGKDTRKVYQRPRNFKALINTEEGWINDLEDKGGNKGCKTECRKKNEKKWRKSMRPLGQQQMHQYPHYSGPRRRREKGPEKYLKI